MNSECVRKFVPRLASAIGHQTMNVEPSWSITG